MQAANLNIKINWKEAYAGSLLKPTMVLEGTRDGVHRHRLRADDLSSDKLPLEQVCSWSIPTTDVVIVGKAMESMHATIPEYKAQYDSSMSSGSPARATTPTNCSPPPR